MHVIYLWCIVYTSIEFHGGIAVHAISTKVFGRFVCLLELSKIGLVWKGLKMRVVFLQDIPNVAEAGDIKTVKRGYAKNYLLPRNLAVVASAHELNRLEAIKKAAVVYRDKQSATMGELAQKIEGLRITIAQRAGPVGQLYGSVTVGMVASHLSNTVGTDIDRRSVSLGQAIRRTGEFEASIRLGTDISASFVVNVISEDSGNAADQNTAVASEPMSDVEAVDQDNSDIETVSEVADPENSLDDGESEESTAVSEDEK